MATTQPVWYLQAGQLDDQGRFQAERQASAVLVNLRTPDAAPRPVLLTVQHALRSGPDQRDGPFHPEYRAWPPGVAYNDDMAVRVTLLAALEPNEAAPLAEPEDLAFLELPPNASGGYGVRLPAPMPAPGDAAPLSVVGYVAGADRFQDHQGIVVASVSPGWRWVSQNPIRGVGVLGGGGTGHGPGGSGGGVFRGEAYLGIYRGEFHRAGEHLFLPLARVQAWCALRGFELVDGGPLDADRAGTGGRAAAPASGDVERVLAGLEALTGRWSEPEPRRAILASRGVLTGLRDILGLFKTYKDLHDRLHHVQLRLGRMQREARQLGTRSESWDLLDEYWLSLAGEEPASRVLLAALPGEPMDLRRTEEEWIGDFAGIVRQGRTGVTRAEAEAVQSSVRTLRRLLRSHLPRLNGKLNVYAKTLDLVGLSRIFADSALAEARDATQRLADRLKVRVDVHSSWQVIDQILWEVDEQLMRPARIDPGDFAAIWGDLQRELDRITAPEAGADWAQELRPLLDRADAARRESNWTAVADVFSPLDRRCRVRFFEVDSDLRAFAGEIAGIGGALADLLTRLAG